MAQPSCFPRWFHIREQKENGSHQLGSILTRGYEGLKLSSSPLVQHVLEHGSPDDKSRIINSLRGRVAVLSAHKFASNVMEKAIANSMPAERAVLINEVLATADGNENSSGSGGGVLVDMMKDQYANYVVQRMLELADKQQRHLLITRIRPLVGTLRKYNYGKHIITKLEKYGSGGNGSGGGGSSNGKAGLVSPTNEHVKSA